ncbi:MAG: hypothetical protein AB4062_10680 [Crocosphaera sp.]
MINNSKQESKIDDLISQIKQEKINKTKQSVKEVNNQPSSTDNLLEKMKSNYQKHQKQELTVDKKVFEPKKQEISQDLSQFKQQLQQKKETQTEKITHQNQEEIRYTEQRKQQQQKLLIRQAKQWLETLDPYSDEGFWFEEFSSSYPSRLDAAVDYLAVVNTRS